MLECRVLGPVDVTVDGVPVKIGGALPRRLLAALVLADGMAVSDDRLALAMWQASRVELFDGAGYLFWWEDPERAAALLATLGRGG
ncbi:hypothetical protein [Kribbella sp. NPDC050470]|uniref:hypothetical protein n=1 Tax=unclassified Kribbella TaxID=2644121 RepID=UPI00379486DE